MAVTTEHLQAQVYQYNNGLEHYAFDELQEIGKTFVPANTEERYHDTPTPSLRICFVDTSINRAARVTDYLRSYGHDVVEHQTTDDIFDPLLLQDYDVLLMGCIGAARVPLIRSVKKLVASYGKDIRIVVISRNDAINRELIAAGADGIIVDADTNNELFNAELTAAFVIAAFENMEPGEPGTEHENIEAATSPASLPSTAASTAELKLVVDPPRAKERAPERNVAANANVLEELQKQLQEQNAHAQTLHFPAPTRDEPVNFSSVVEKAAKPDAPTSTPQVETPTIKPDEPANTPNPEKQAAKSTTPPKEESPQAPRAEKPKSKRDDSNNPPPAPRPDPVFVAIEKARKGESGVPAPTSRFAEFIWMLGMIPGKVPIALLALAWGIFELVTPSSQNM